ncbi:hypothetical protein Y032_0160g3335 [Ancylostoma ceylanicum]|uniref:Uncharacterized protein n=1 Tax=Ancylostoma ceylanicum TaxID=53326 RepID=A0A016SYJ4_9BILA|nr:hypothetical protein Y032_0160g3335 [Ancylostoma ceylanicum]
MNNRLLCNFVLVVIAIDFLVIYTFLLTSHRGGLQISHNTTAFETSRKALQVMSDSLDCSLLMKEAALEKFIVQHQMLLGVACLALVVPYSVQPHSSMTMMMYYKQNRESLIQSYRNGEYKFNETCHAGKRCSIRSYYKIMRSYVEFNSQFKDSLLKSVWLAPDMDVEKASKWLGRTSDASLNLTDIDRHLLLRRFRKPLIYNLAMKDFSDISYRNLLYNKTE